MNITQAHSNQSKSITKISVNKVFRLDLIVKTMQRQLHTQGTQTDYTLFRYLGHLSFQFFSELTTFVKTHCVRQFLLQQTAILHLPQS